MMKIRIVFDEKKSPKAFIRKLLKVPSALSSIRTIVMQRVMEELNDKVVANFLAQVNARRNSVYWEEKKKSYIRTGEQFARSGSRLPVKYSNYGFMTGFFFEKLSQKKLGTTQFFHRTVSDAPGIKGGTLNWGIILPDFFEDTARSIGYPAYILDGEVVDLGGGKGLISLGASDIQRLRDSLFFNFYLPSLARAMREAT